MATSHVLIRGHVFTYEEKAPFVASGHSLLGAVEFDREADLCKCHECGEFVRGLGNHIKKHGLKRAQYNRRHGMRRRAPLGVPGIGKLHRKRVAANNFKGVRAMLAATAQKRPEMPEYVHSVETLNLNARCMAQLIYRTQILASQIGHFPNHQELRDAGISAAAIRKSFGGIPAMAALAGLQSNGSGQRTPSPLPQNYPKPDEIRKKWNERMPWPDDYSRIQPFQQVINSTVSRLKFSKGSPLKYCGEK